MDFYTGVYSECYDKLLEILNRYVFDKSASFPRPPSAAINDFVTEIVVNYLTQDIEEFAKDPAALNVFDPKKYVLEIYKGMEAIVYYRIAHKLLEKDVFSKIANEDVMSIDNMEDVDKTEYTDDDDSEEFASADFMKDYYWYKARELSEVAAKETKIEINPFATVGRGFVIDHGIDTRISPVQNAEFFSCVIGETCTIGEYCTILNGVTIKGNEPYYVPINNGSISTGPILGAANFDGKPGKRHPTIGNHVMICAGVRILGNIEIGDNVFISPGCVITSNIPSNYKVSIINQLQYQHTKEKTKDEGHNSTIIYGLFANKDYLTLQGENIHGIKLSILDTTNGNCVPMPNFEFEIIEEEYYYIKFRLKPNASENTSNVSSWASLKIAREDREFILYNPPALNKAIRNLLKKTNLLGVLDNV
jgi:serine acetyltransferase